VRKLTTFVVVVALAAGLAACNKHGAKNVYGCPSKGPGVGFKGVKSGKVTVQTVLPDPGYWKGASVDTLTGGYEFELAKDVCAQLGVGRVRIVNVARTALQSGQTRDFDLAIAHIAITDERGKNVDVSTAYFTSAQGAQYAVLLPKGSANTKLVNAAIAKLKTNGTLDALSKRWPTPAG
jgi:polar amino acid transport system substrate-binding protein